jgi:peptidoglycan/LPS O-acetylase OafA/YrhL
MSAPSRSFVVLDGLRGVAAIAIVFFHLALIRGDLPGEGYLAVDFFFVLSGFVLAHAYGSRLQQGSMSFGRFVLIRMIRLYPLYFLGSVIALPIALRAAVRSRRALGAEKRPMAAARPPPETVTNARSTSQHRLKNG